MLGLANYAKIKNNYCVCYLGPCEEYLLQFKLLKPTLQFYFPGINIGFGCRDELSYIFEGEPLLMKSSEIKAKREMFAHIKEVKFDGRVHPVEQFLNECDIKH